MLYIVQKAFLSTFIWLLSTVLFFAQASSKSSIEAPSSSSKPNIIIFLVDDLGYGDLGCYGNPIVKTPNIDRLAREGVRLTDCHSAATVCSPSRAAILTGRNPYRSGFYDILGSFNCYLQRQEITLPEILKPVGYSTCFVGKWHLSRFNNNVTNSGENNQPSPGEQGFDYWFATALNAFEGPRNPKKFIRNGTPVGDVKGSYCDVIVKEACDWMSLRKKDQPFFLEICTHEPHTPIDPPEEYSKPYENTTVDSLEKTIRYGGVPRPTGISNHKDKYYGTVAQLDHAFGQLMKFLDSTGLEKNTIVIFTSDNGPESPVNFDESRGMWMDTIRDKCFGTPGLLRGMKRFVYEGGHRVPGIVRWPSKIPAGIVSDKLVNGTDFFSTICKIAGVKEPDDRAIDGTNILPALLNRHNNQNRSVIWLLQLNEDMYAKMGDMSLRYHEYTLIGRMPVKADSETLLSWMYNSKPEKFELYNIVKDPEQQFDIANNHPGLLKKLIPMMTKMWINIRDEGKMSKPKK
ncbi:sulfatase [Haliscomenobacter hydrossis]|uniref:N-acetylgalactosamine-6-sulfatase n=1 Tax=Haliscomenobacter hydrossis (strain ATCC 27775 / DSM 1100 / LMG 10767 / O) TaxID=760192 RepID=F4KT44_HALH1|nr:sulfatase-like hydrolase/transferase [Haliscomenobacter hydrossis]AEE50114.1 N-acetylgalactosamine-6-sulfatase [Haliscomenobacter hydrossis DSM 1100]